MQGAIAHATQGADGLALLYLDLDGFKAANDRGGREASDRVLREVAQPMQLRSPWYRCLMSRLPVSSHLTDPGRLADRCI